MNSVLLRRFLRRPRLAILVVTTLALGIGAATAIYSVVDGVLVQSSPHRDPAALMMLWGTDTASGSVREPASWPDFVDFREQATGFERLTAFAGAHATIDANGLPQRHAALQVADGFLATLGVTPLLGRGIVADDLVPGAAPVLLVGETLWRTRFGADPAVIGEHLQVDGVDRRVVGVVPSGAEFGFRQVLGSADYLRAFADSGEESYVGMYLPFRVEGPLAARDHHTVFVLARLGATQTLAAARAESEAIAADLATNHRANRGRGVHVEPLTDIVTGPVRPPLYALLAAVALVMLVACTNAANLMLAATAERRREIAVRAAIGASTKRLLLESLAEGLAMALLAGALGLAIASFSTELLLAAAPADLPRAGEIGLNGRVLGIAFSLTLLVGLLSSALPALQAAREGGGDALRGGGTTAMRGGGWRNALVVVQFALAAVLVVGVLLLTQTIWRMQAIDPGFRTAGVIKAEFSLPRASYPVDFSRWPDFAEIHAFNRDLLDGLAAQPEVVSAALASSHPLAAGFTNSFLVRGREAESAEWPEISVRRVSPGYFETVSLPVAKGRALVESDRTHAAPVLAINAAAAARYFPDGRAIGQQILLWGTARTIVGVVGDERFGGLTEAVPPAVYLPLAQAPPVDGAQTLLLKGHGDAAVLAAIAERTIRRADPGLAVFGIEPLSETVGRSFEQQRFLATSLGAFSAFAALLALLGIHGVLSYLVASRTAELGLRLALGATQAGVRLLVVAHGARLALTGLAIGLVAALAGSTVLERFLYGVNSADARTYAAVAAVLFICALAVSWIPAWRATRTDPMQALRQE